MLKSNWKSFWNIWRTQNKPWKSTIVSTLIPNFIYLSLDKFLLVKRFPEDDNANLILSEKWNVKKKNGKNENGFVNKTFSSVEALTKQLDQKKRFFCKKSFRIFCWNNVIVEVICHHHKHYFCHRCTHWKGEGVKGYKQGSWNKDPDPTPPKEKTLIHRYDIKDEPPLEILSNIMNPLPRIFNERSHTFSLAFSTRGLLCSFLNSNERVGFRFVGRTVEELKNEALWLW